MTPAWAARAEIRATPAEYRGLMSAFPSGVVVLTTQSSDGTPCGMTCSALSSVTATPPTLLVCLRSNGLTLAAVRRHGAFAVNLLHERGREAADIFASPVPDRFERVRWLPAQRSGLPWLVDDAFALAECVVTGGLSIGDHTVVLGEVMAVTQRPDVPLTYGLRRYQPFKTDSGQTGR